MFAKVRHSGCEECCCCMHKPDTVSCSRWTVWVRFASLSVTNVAKTFSAIPAAAFNSAMLVIFCCITKVLTLGLNPLVIIVCCNGSAIPSARFKSTIALSISSMADSPGFALLCPVIESYQLSLPDKTYRWMIVRAYRMKILYRVARFWTMTQRSFSYSSRAVLFWCHHLDSRRSHSGWIVWSRSTHLQLWFRKTNRVPECRGLQLIPVSVSSTQHGFRRKWQR